MVFRRLIRKYPQRHTSRRLSVLHIGALPHTAIKRSCLQRPSDRLMKRRQPSYGKFFLCLHKAAEKLPSPACSMTRAYQTPQNTNACMECALSTAKIQKNSTLWKYYTISAMLTNEMYIGNMVQGRYGSISYKTKQNKPRPKSEWYIVEHTHEPVIDRQLWDRVQALTALKAKPFSTGTIGLFAKKPGAPAADTQCALPKAMETII